MDEQSGVVLVVCAWESLGFRATQGYLLLSRCPRVVRGPHVEETLGGPGPTYKEQGTAEARRALFLVDGARRVTS